MFTVLSSCHLPTPPAVFGIDITHLEPGFHTWSLRPSAEELDLDPAVFRNLLVEVRLELGRERALVLLEAQAVARLECDRTLVEFEQPVRGEYSLLLVPEDRLEEAAEKDEEALPLPQPGETLDLTGAVRDTLVLALPVRRIAPGAEEQEIPLRFGSPPEEGAPADPRFEALRKLRDPS